MRLFFGLCSIVLISACVESPPQNTVSRIAFSAGPTIGQSTDTVWTRVKHVAQNMCLDEVSPGARQTCEFEMKVQASQPARPNAISWLDPSGKTQIRIDKSLLSRLKNDDEVAFVLAHETAHSVAAHHSGTTNMGFSSNSQIGRKIRPEIELEADAIGTIVAMRAGFDPLAGSNILKRLYAHRPEGTKGHPSLARRLAIVEKVHRVIRGGGRIDLD